MIIDPAGVGLDADIENKTTENLAEKQISEHDRAEMIEDEKDKKIRELSAQLHRANQQLAECREQLNMVLKGVELHTNHLTKSIQDIIKNMKEIEDNDDEE
ncbi:hypothetical protein LguiB_030920 [Lonicera macranthoides]